MFWFVVRILGGQYELPRESGWRFSDSPKRTGGWEQYRRFSELIFMSVGGHVVFAAFYGLYLWPDGHWPGAVLAFGSDAAVVPLVQDKDSAPAPPTGHHVITPLIDFAGLNIALIWMGMPAHTAARWCALWPMFVPTWWAWWTALIWLLVGCGGVLFIWANEQHGWLTPPNCALKTTQSS